MASSDVSKSVLDRAAALGPSSFAWWSGYLSTFATEFLVMISQILLYKLAAHYLGTRGFSEYSLARRTVSLLQPAVMLGLGVGLPRYIAMSRGRGQPDSFSDTYFSIAFRAVGAAVISAAVILALFSSTFAFLIYGDSSYRSLIPPLALMLVGLAIHSVVYAYLRGHLQLGRANILNLVNLGISPLLVFWKFGTNVLSLLWALGTAWTIVAVSALVWAPLRSIMEPWPADSRDLLRYGLQRVPGDFSLLALLALPAILAAHESGVETAGYVAFGVSVANMIAAVFTPIGIILLPKASRSASRGGLDEMRHEIVLVGAFSILVPVVAVSILEFFMPDIIRLYLGPSFTSSVAFSRIAIMSSIPLALYYVLRNIIDAVHERALNTLNLVFSLILFIAMSSVTFWARQGATAILWAFVVAVLALAVLTTREVSSILHPDRKAPS